jgi:hypothetical protein
MDIYKTVVAAAATTPMGIYIYKRELNVSVDAVEGQSPGS